MANTNTNLETIRNSVEQFCQNTKKERQNTESALDVQDLERAEKSAREASDNAFKALQEAQSLTEEDGKTDKGKAIKKLADQAQKNAMEAHHLIDVRKRPIRLLENILNINTFLKLMPIIGFAILFIYFIVIDYFPRGLSFSDSLLVIFLAISYGIMYLILIGIPISFITFVYDLFKIKNWLFKIKNWQWPIGLCGLCGLYALIFCACREMLERDIVIIVVFFLSIPIFIIVALYANIPLKMKIWTWLVIIILILILVIKIESNSNFSILKFTMKELNFSRENTTLLLSESDYRLVRNLAIKENLPVLYGCEKDSTLVHNVDILWNNLGENIYIRLPESLEKGKPEFRMEVKHSDTKIIDRKIIDRKPESSETVLSEGCVTVHIPNLFDAGQSDIADQKAEDAVKLIPGWINNLMEGKNGSNQAKKYAIEKINITGYADITPYRKGSNQKLSEERAKAFEEYLKTKTKAIMSSKGEGNKNASDECKKKFAVKEDIDYCQGLNRGVTLEFQISMAINKNAQAESK